MISLNMIRYISPATLQMSEDKIRLLKLKTDFIYDNLKSKSITVNYRDLLLKEANKLAATQ